MDSGSEKQKRAEIPPRPGEPNSSSLTGSPMGDATKRPPGEEGVRKSSAEPGKENFEHSSISSDAWQAKKSFAVETSEDGHTIRIEGWLSVRDARRSSKDRHLQNEVMRGASVSKDAGHLIAHSLGGPTREHEPTPAKANLVPMDLRINRSHLRAVEMSVRKDLRSGDEIYCQAMVQYRSEPDGRKVPETVTHRYFKKGRDGLPKAYKIESVTTRVEQRPSETLDESVRKTTDGKEGAADFTSATRRGTARLKQ
jgi:hypothetical protein